MALPTQTHGDGQTSPVPSIVHTVLREPITPDPTVLVTGYHTTAAQHIVDRLLEADSRTILCVVVRDRWTDASRVHRGAQKSGRLRLIEGSASAPGLGLPHTEWRVLDTTDEIYAVASPQEIAAGHIQDFADECTQLRDVHIVPQSPDSVRSKWNALRRASTSIAFPKSIQKALSGPARLTRAVGSLKRRLGFTIEAVFSSEDIESDLWPGLQRTV